MESPIDGDARGDEYDGVKLLSCDVPETGDPQTPAIDVVHVMGVMTDLERLPLSHLIPSNVMSVKREFTFDLDTPLLADDLEMTLEIIGGQARRLLTGLKQFRHSRSDPSAIVFVAYDLGALVVKKSMSIAEVEFEQSDWKEIFIRTVRFVFHGCFQRKLDEEDWVLEILKFLQRCENKPWTERLTLRAVTQLEVATHELNEVFLSSEVIHRSRVFSLYAPESGSRRISKVFNWYTATLGLATELPVPIDAEDPSLANKISFVVQSWVPERSFTSIQRTLTSVVPRQYQMQSRCESPSHPVLHSVSHQSWLKCNGVRVLYLHGPSHASNIQAAEQVGLACTARAQARGQLTCRPFFFAFSEQDPTHNAVKHMFAASLLQSLPEVSSTDLLKCSITQVLLDLLQIHRSWTDEDLRTALSLIVVGPSSTSLVLLDMDMCEFYSRMVFWSFLEGLARTSEDQLNVVVTSTRPRSLTEELRRFPDIQVDEYTTSTSLQGPELLTDVDYRNATVQRFCPRRLGEARIRACLNRLAAMDQVVLEFILDFLSSTTRWPEVVTYSNLSSFCTLLEDVSPESTAKTVLSQVLGSIDDQAGLEWILGWLLCAYRPFETTELATMMCYGRAGLETRELPPSSSEVERAKLDLSNTLVGIGSWNDNRVQIRPNILALMDGDGERMWTGLRKSAHQTTATFLLDYLALPQTRDRLEDIYIKYQTRLESGDKLETPALTSNGQEGILFYAVQALPHHLDATGAPTIDTDTAEMMKDPDGPFSVWSQVYWAMSNPFTRQQSGPSRSAWETLRYGPQSVQTNMVGSLSFHEDVATKSEDTALSGMEQLASAVTADNEDLAIHLAQQLEDHNGMHSETKSSDGRRLIPWPTKIIWRAAWLDMHRLMSVFLRTGANVNDTTSTASPSLIYMASFLGYSQMVTLLLSHGADLTLLKDGSSALNIAACNGHLGVVKAILARRGDLLNVQQPEAPLYSAALWGSWKLVEYLVAIPGVDLDQKNAGGWTPLITACDDGYVETVRLLLAHGADPNITGPNDENTALSYVIGRYGRAEIAQMLLENGATIDHAALTRPLLCDIADEPGLSAEDKLSFCDILIQHDPSLDVDKADPAGWTPLILAAMDGNVTLIKWLLRHGSDINRTSHSGRHALFCAVEEQKHAAAEELLNHDISPILDIESNGSTTNTLLEAAVTNSGNGKDISLLEMLLDAGANMEFENSDKQTAFTIAVDDGQTDIVKLLLERGVDISHRDIWGYTPLLTSISHTPNTEILRLLVDNGANLNDTLNSHASRPTALHLAVRNADTDKVRILLEFHTSIDLNPRDAHGNTPLLAAVSWDNPQNIECLKLLIRVGADVNDMNSDGKCLLMKSSYVGEKSSAVHDFLLSRPEIRVNAVSPKYGTPLQVACRKGHVQLINKLISRGVDIDLAVPRFAPTALISACLPWLYCKEENNTVEEKEWAVRELVTRGAKANYMSKNSIGFMNALCAASFGARVGIINFLLDSGASAQQADPMGRLPIHFAAANGLRNFQAIALVYTGDIMAGDKAEKNALHWAAQFGHVETIKAILERLPRTERSTRIDCRDKDGWTPLAWAMRPTIFSGDFWVSTTLSEKSDYSGTVQYLIELGADVSVTFQQGRENTAEVLTLAELARRCGAVELAQLVTSSEKPEPNNIGANEGESPLSSSRIYVDQDLQCNICFSTVYGIVYTCHACTGVRFCTKCHRNIELYHEHVIDDGQIHTFGIAHGNGDREFVEPDPLTSTALLQETNSEEVTGIKAPAEDPDAVDLSSENDVSRDDITEVDFSDLKDLGSFTD